MGWTCLEGGWKNYKTSYRRKNCEEKTCRKTPNKISILDVVRKDLKMINENLKMEDANDRIRWNEIMVAAMDLHGPLSC